MRISRGTLISFGISVGISAGLLLMALPSFALGRPRTTSARRHYHASLKHTSGMHVAGKHKRGSHFAIHHEAAVAEMPAERATEIQTALIKQGYLTGEPSGTWDAQTVSAMQKLQADNGWQRKVTPDSRALIKLGLGPQASAPDPDSSRDMAQTPQP